MAIQSNRNLGCISSCLMLLGAVSAILLLIQYRTLELSLNSGILGISGIISLLVFVGFILFLVAMHGLSKDYAEPRIFNYVLYGLIISIVLAVVIGVIWFALFMISVFNEISASNLIAVASPIQIQSDVVKCYAPLLAAMTFVSLVSVLYNYKAFNLLSVKSGVNGFRTAAKIFVAGGIVNVVVGILLAVLGLLGIIEYNAMLLSPLPGGLIQYFAWGLAAKAFFIIPIAPSTLTQSSTRLSTNQEIYCGSCGTRNESDWVYCSCCGQKR